MMPTQFSVVIPLYNKRNGVLAALESVRQQRFAASEIIVVDDGSTDDGAELVEALDMPNLRLIRQVNQGVSKARNVGVEQAKHDYIAFLDADDQWTPFFLHEINRLIRRFPGQGLYACRYQKMHGEAQFSDAKIALNQYAPKGYVMNDFFDVAGKGDLPFMVSSSVVEKAYYQSVGGFPLDEWMGEDQSFFIRAAIDGKIAYSPQIRLHYCVEAENRASEKRPPAQACPFAERLLNWIELDRVPAEQIPAATTYLAAHVCNLAKRNIQAGYPVTGRRLLRHPLASHKPYHKAFWMVRSWCSHVLASQRAHVLSPVTKS